MFLLEQSKYVEICFEFFNVLPFHIVWEKNINLRVERIGEDAKREGRSRNLEIVKRHAATWDSDYPDLKNHSVEQRSWLSRKEKGYASKITDESADKKDSEQGR